FVKVANMIRDAFKAGTGMDVTMSTRTLIRWVRLSVLYKNVAERGFSPVHYAMDLALANGTSAPVSESIHQLIVQVMGASQNPGQASGDAT
ncbi:ATPase, partial [mine drainage metagenome]